MESETGKRVVILGTQSFVDGGSKVGSQYLAEGLARHGWQVTYLATASSPVDIWGGKRRQRLKRVWHDGQDTVGVPIAPGLTEFAFKAIIPAHRLFLRFSWQMAGFRWLLPAWLRTAQFDACISDVTTNLIFLPWINARCKILRLNDWPPGFAHDLHPMLIRYMERGLRQATYEEVWAVSTPLVQYAQKLNVQNKVVLMPNGVDMAPDHIDPLAHRELNSAIYIGGLTAWLDIPLLQQVAEKLPHWTIHVYAPGAEQLHSTVANLHFHPAVRREDVASLLARHEVGLIPFNNADERMDFVERPLKFYEYVAAGLGVASTDHGALRQGMGNLASYGNTPQTFAQAMVDARAQAAQRAPGFTLEFTQRHGWPAVMRGVEDRLQAVCQGNRGD